MHPRHFCRRLLAAFALSGMVVGAVALDAPVAGASTAANRSYVRALYGDLLDRTNSSVNARGVEYWANKLGSSSRLSVARGIQYSSDEYFAKLVEIGYAVYLDRSPDPSGAGFLVRGWKSRRFTYERMIATLVGSDEYFRRSGSTNAGFVNKAYADILGGEPTTSARNYFVRVAATRGRATVAILLATSHQAEVAIVRYEYSSFLGRDVDPGALRFWVNRLAGGFRREDFDVTLLASNEYYAKSI